MQKCYFFQISMKVSKNDSGFMRVAKKNIEPTESETGSLKK